MSASEDENFDLDISGSESEDYAPAPKKTAKAAPKIKPAPKAKAPAKTKSAPKKKVLADKDANGEQMDVDSSSDEAGPSVPAAPAAPTNGKKKSASETYTKLSQLEHILKRPDSYIGSVETVSQPMWVWDSETKRMINKEIKYVPGFFKIVDEILVNAADNKINDPSMDTIKVTIDTKNNVISVYNNGRGIPIEMHSREKIYIPELIFGHLLSSSNYDDDEKKLTGGRNGYGAKLANIYSVEFTVDTADKNTEQKYSQTWTNNMSKMGNAKITKNGKKEEYTRVTFRPDLKRFGMESIDDDTVALLMRRVYDLAGTVKNIKVFLNDERLKVKNFKQYVELYLNSAAEQAAEASGGAAQIKPSIIYEQINSRWEIAFAVSEGPFQHMSFANSIATTKGGSHVTLISDQIAKNLIAFIGKRNKGAALKPGQIKNHMWLFVNALIENPTFDSQTKETLTLTASKFGTKPVLSEEFMKKVQKSAIVDHVLNWAKYRADREMKKTDGNNRRTRLMGLPKLADANNAGTRKASDCTLILTEGDSAKALAVAGLGVVGRDNFGVFPLRGKLLNVRDAKHDQIMKNEEIQNIKKILGLQHNKDYQDTGNLRYGRLMIMTDQDHDGSHIKGLLINYLDHFYPSLLKLPRFLVEFVTPIVRVWKGKEKINFYTIPEYESWMENTPDAHKWGSKYFKGLGTSSSEDARDYFSNMRKHLIPFATMQDEERELIELAFSKKKADERKEWLRQFKPGTYLDHSMDEIPYTDFINKELILFSMADNIRSIPSVADGLKPGQRKVIWGCFKRKLRQEIKVAQLVGYISEHAGYHHGEQSLMSTIISLAQDYIGSNNMNLLMPNGQFGTRDQGGKDHAAARYIFTEPSPLTRMVFHPADDPLLNYLKEDNDPIEPEWYMPIIPTVLINGVEGIGTGWSTSIPSYNPVDIVANIRRMMAGQELEPMLPWWRGFKGTIKKVGEHKYDVAGLANKIDDTTIEITELPIHKWTQNYKVELEAMCGEKGDGVVKDYKEHHDNVNVHFIVHMDEKDVKKAEEQGLIEFFKLTTKINTSNMMCFDLEGKMKKYSSPEEILEEFYPERLKFYQKRKDHLASELQLQFDKLSNQARFVQMIVKKELNVHNRKKTDIVNELRKLSFKPFPKVAKAKAAGETEAVVEEDDDQEEPTAIGGNNSTDFDYLLGMAIWSLTKEKIDKLLEQAAMKEAELLALLELKPNDLWNTDLDNFLQEWDRVCQEWETKSATAKNAKLAKGKRKQAVLNFKKPTKKKGGSDEEDDDDDFKPVKAAPKPRKAAEAKAPAKKPAAAVVPSGSKVEIKDDDDEKSVAAPKKRVVKKPALKEESDSDVEVIEKPPPRAAASKKKPVEKVGSDSEFEIVPAASKDKGKGKAKAAPSAKSKLDSDDDDDDYIKPLKKTTQKPASKASTATKRKSPDVEDDSDDAMYLKPVKKSRSEKPQAAVTDFFDKVPAGTAAAAAAKKPTSRKPSSSSQSGTAKAKAVAPAKRKKVIESEEEDVSMGEDDLPPAPPRNAPPKRAARGAAKKYIEIVSSDEEEGDARDDSAFEDFD